MKRIFTTLFTCGLVASMGLALPASAAAGKPAQPQVLQADQEAMAGKLLVRPKAGGIEFHNDNPRSHVRIEITGLKPFDLKPGQTHMVQPKPQAGNPPRLNVYLREGKDSFRLHSGGLGPIGGRWKMEIPIELEKKK